MILYIKFINKKKLEEYDFLQEIHTSKTGKIYKCFSKKLGNTVAIKIFEFFENDELDLIIKEFNNNKNNKNLISVYIYDLFIYSNKLFLVMEYFENGSLFDIILKNNQISNKFIPIIIKNIWKSIKFIHDQNNCYKNLKPTKIYFNNQGDVKLKDYFCTDKILDIINKSKTQLSINSFYLAPEIIKEGKYYKESDIWALGIISYELIKGKNPYQNFSPSKAIFEITKKSPPKLNKNYSKYFNKNI